MADITERLSEKADDENIVKRRLSRSLITTLSVAFVLLIWEAIGPSINPVFGSYPSAIAVAFWELTLSGKLWAALYESLQPFVVGYFLAIAIGIPLGLIVGRFRTMDAALGIYITAGYAMPLVALVPLLILWLGLGFKVKVAVIFLMSLFPICINTWVGVTAVPKSLIEVGKSFVASDAVILTPHRAAGDACPTSWRAFASRSAARSSPWWWRNSSPPSRGSAPSSSTRPTISTPRPCSCRSCC